MQGDPGEGEEEEEEPLWTFHEVKTLPQPNLDITADRHSLHVRVRQSECDPQAVVRNWRITHCNHVPKDTTSAASASDSGDSDEALGSGDDGVEGDHGRL